MGMHLSPGNELFEQLTRKLSESSKFSPVPGSCPRTCKYDVPVYQIERAITLRLDDWVGSSFTAHTRELLRLDNV